MRFVKRSGVSRVGCMHATAVPSQLGPLIAQPRSRVGFFRGRGRRFLQRRTGCFIGGRFICRNRAIRKNGLRGNDRVFCDRLYARQTVRRDLHDGAERKLRKERGHIRRFHTDAPEAGRPAKAFFLSRSVNVNAAAVSVGVFRL